MTSQERAKAKAEAISWKNLGFTNHEIAEKLGVTADTVARWTKDA